jgi:hypothetical protein
VKNANRSLVIEYFPGESPDYAGIEPKYKSPTLK